MNKDQPQIIAFYLPQFYPFPENDEWWGKGFTEWTNVGKAKPLFRGHDQPRVPTELGYYDLRLPIVREQQAEMAREAGVTAFCYWHYWFGNGKRLIADVFNEVMESGKPDFPFCLGWANHSWYAKNWNSDGTTTNKILIEQTYPGVEDAKMHFDFLLKAFRDTRYVKIDGKPFFYIYDPDSIPAEYIRLFREWTQEGGFPDLYLVANIVSPSVDKNEVLKKGFDAVNFQRLAISFDKNRLKRGWVNYGRKLKGLLLHRPANLADYRKVYPELITEEDKELCVIPSLVPQWDHTPRSGWNGALFVHSTPDYFYRHALMALDAVRDKPVKHRILFLKSWNEWGEGNYMEPDITHGRGFIEALRSAVDAFEK